MYFIGKEMHLINMKYGFYSISLWNIICVQVMGS